VEVVWRVGGGSGAGALVLETAVGCAGVGFDKAWELGRGGKANQAMVVGGQSCTAGVPVCAGPGEVSGLHAGVVMHAVKLIRNATERTHRAYSFRLQL